MPIKSFFFKNSPNFFENLSTIKKDLTIIILNIFRSLKLFVPELQYEEKIKNNITIHFLVHPTIFLNY